MCAQTAAAYDAHMLGVLSRGFTYGKVTNCKCVCHNVHNPQYINKSTHSCARQMHLFLVRIG